MLDRWVNILFIFTLVVIFITYGEAEGHKQILFALLLAVLLATTAFILNWLTLDGASAAIIFGTIAYGLGGLTGAAVILAFFITGIILSKNEKDEANDIRRSGSQVWANGFWFALGVVIWYLTQNMAFLAAAVSSIAMATADTWATEIGASRLEAKTRLITTGEKVAPGTNGGISFYGTLAAFIGALFITLVFGFLNMHISYWLLIIIVVTGFLGCFIDSYLGALIQGRSYSSAVISLLGLKYFYINNNVINWLACGFTAILSLVIILISGI